MAIEFSCSQCGATLRVPEQHAGKMAACPNCKSVNSIPEASTIAAATPIAASANVYAKPVPNNPYGTPGYPAAHQTPHRGGLILALGIVSLMCNFMLIPSILAWVWGRSDLQQIRAGQMDRTGEGLTQAGMIIGIIMTCIPLIVFALYIIFLFVVFLIAVLGNI